MPRDSDVTIVLLYPDLLGTYGDRGNSLALVHRARARGLPVRVIEVAPDEHAPQSADVYLIGGGEDAAQVLAWQTLRTEKSLIRALQDGATCLAVCAGFQLLSLEFTDRDGDTVPGLGVLDVRCGRLKGRRAVGEVVADPCGIPGLPTLTSYENHQGDAFLGPDAQPLGRLVWGTGNGDGATEGAVQGNVVATYMHGPVLVRNPALADHLLERSTGPLAPFCDEAVERLRRDRLHGALAHSYAPAMGQRGARLWSTLFRKDQRTPWTRRSFTGWCPLS
jgi:CobQ-like glutamine amidotransferase family enzyme